MNKPIMISFSGGRTSAFMTEFMLNHALYRNNPKIVLFANTGKEREETLKFVDMCDKHLGFNVIWVEAEINPEKGKGTRHKIVTYETATRGGYLFDKMIDKYGLPNKSFPHCTWQLKVLPLESYMKEEWGNDFITAAGIRADEEHRVNRKKKNYIYPLVDDLKVDSNFIRTYWETKHYFDLELKDYEGNCDFCWKKSRRKRLTLLDDGLDVSDWIRWEKNSKFNFDRDNISVIDLVEMSKHPFGRWDDLYLSNKNQMKLFNDDLDIELDCFCKST